MSEIRYKYAYNENGEFIDIESVSSENRHERHFHCVSCGEELIPRLGKVRTHHFAHKVADVSCNKETYLHKIGKWLLKSKFDESESFFIEYQRKVKCKNSEKEKRKPVLIEIRVSHECTEEKQESGAKIIEFRVKSEDDLLRIVDSNIIKEQEDKVKFIGFSQETVGDKILDHRSLYRFYLYKSGKVFVCRSDCNKTGKQKAILELNIDPYKIPYSRVYEYGVAKSLAMGFDIRNCVLCKNSSRSFSGHTVYCNRRELHEISDPLNPIEANKCPYYFFNRMMYEGILRMFSNVTSTVVEQTPL